MTQDSEGPAPAKAQVHNREGMTGPHDVSKELWREYIFPNNETYRIRYPVGLYVKRKQLGDSHRVLDNMGIVHYVREGWIALRWEPKDRADPVQF